MREGEDTEASHDPSVVVAKHAITLLTGAGQRLGAQDLTLGGRHRGAYRVLTSPRRAVRFISDNSFTVSRGTGGVGSAIPS